MGWRYGPAYTRALPYLLWEKATGIRWAAEWRSQQVYFLLYGTRGDRQLPKFGDSWDMNLIDDNTCQILTANAGIFNNSHAEWLYQTHFQNKTWEPFLMWRIMNRNPDVKPVAPTLLPLARHFPNSGFVVSRDGWDATTTQLVTKSTSFASLNHQHKDQNSIELSYKGSLLISSGVYDEYPSEHFLNYFSRTIAANSMVVHDPAETFSLWGVTRSNDGGQKFIDPNLSPGIGASDPITLEDVTSPKYKLDGITEFASNSSGSWSRGDASKAYNSQKLTAYKRDLLMIHRPAGRKRPFILVYDWVLLGKSLLPKIIFHPREFPTISGKTFSFSNYWGGVLQGQVLLPANARIQTVGYTGQEYTVEGQNYPTIANNKGVDPGTQRIEISPSANTVNQTFLTLLSVDDRDALLGFPKATLVATSAFAGAIVGSEMYLISPFPTAATSWTFAGTQYANVTKVYVAGLKAGVTYSFKVGGKTYNSGSSNLVFFNKK